MYDNFCNGNDEDEMCDHMRSVIMRRGGIRFVLVAWCGICCGVMCDKREGTILKKN